MDTSYGQAFAVSENDTEDFRPGFVSDALYIGATGNLVVLMEDGKEATFPNVPVGVIRLRCKRLLAASTVSGVLALKE